MAANQRIRRRNGKQLQTRNGTTRCVPVHSPVYCVFIKFHLVGLTAVTIYRSRQKSGAF